MTTDPFNGLHQFDNTVRLVVVFFGITLALLCVRFAWQAWRRVEIERMWGTLSFGFIVVTPAVIGLLRFGEPLYWPSTFTFLAGLVCAVIALTYRVALSPPWKRVRARWKTRTEARRTVSRDREDVDRQHARRREDDALSDDRVREDDALHDARGREDEQ